MTSRLLAAAVISVAACAIPSEPQLARSGGTGRVSAAAPAVADALPPAEAEGCSSGGWCWDNPLPRGSDFMAVSGHGRGIVVAGDEGSLLRFDGRRWVDAEPPTRDAVVALHQGARALFAATRGGSLLRCQGGAWTTLRRDLQRPLQMWGVEDALWVIDDDGVLRFDGDRWHREALGFAPRAIGGAHAARVVVVGDGGRIARFDGQRWHDWDGPSRAPLGQVWVGPATVIVSGGDGTFVHDGEKWHRAYAERTVGCWGRASVTRCLRDDGETWFLQRGEWKRHGAARIVAPPLRALYSPDGRDAYAVGDRGAVYRFDDAAWEELSHGDRRRLRAVWGRAHDGARDVWAVGDGGVVLRWRYDRFVVALDLATTRGLRSVWVSDRGDMWAVGQAGLMVHFDGARFEVLEPTRRDLYAVRGRAHDDVWAVGDRVALHFDGTRWQAQPAPDAVLAAVTPGGALFGLYDGTFTRRGDAWLPLDRAPVRAACASSEGLFTVGHRARRFDGAAWFDEHVPRVRLDDVLCLGAGRAWAVGEAGAILWRGADARWRRSDSGTARALHGVWGDGDAVFAVGDAGTILRREMPARRGGAVPPM